MAGLMSLSQALFTSINKRASEVAIMPILDDSVRKASSEADDFQNNLTLSFQYFPETLTDTKAVNYSTKNIPGASLPLYQWVSGGERLISFTAYFSCDNDLISPGKSGLFNSLKVVGQERRNVDIRAAVFWLRRYMLPTYETDSATKLVQTKAPKKMMLIIPGSGMGMAGGAFPGGYMHSDAMVCIMKQCDVTYESFFTSGLPRLASVQLAFAQSAQVDGLVRFPHSDPKIAARNRITGTYGYNISPRNRSSAQ
jgi:hypothetical protein